jgi:DNA-directed RNA polymerase subunit RPC12/RpoP
MSPICVRCRREMKVVMIGVHFLIEAPDIGPYEVRHGDVHECDDCGARIAIMARQPSAQHHEPDFAARCADVDVVVPA